MKSRTYTDMIQDAADALGVEEVLLQLAEESAELNQACVKYHRAKHNLTPLTEEEALAMVAEEAADVSLILDQLYYLFDPHHSPHLLDDDLFGDYPFRDRLDDTKQRKAERWWKRLNPNTLLLVQR